MILTRLKFYNWFKIQVLPIEETRFKQLLLMNFFITKHSSAISSCNTAMLTSQIKIEKCNILLLETKRTMTR